MGWRSRITSTGIFLFASALFALSTAQAPLFYSNQNQYLLHGYTLAGHGDLGGDWLANTHSPTPLFDGLVALVVTLKAEWAMHVFMALLQGVYFHSLLGLFAGRFSRGGQLAFAAILFFLHSALLRWASYRLLGWDYPCYLQGWFAAQYILGPVFQPSAFGVFLLLGLERFQKDRPLQAAACVAFAGVMHSTYLLSGGLLVIGFVAILLKEKQYRRAAATAGLALLLVLPTLIQIALVFKPHTATVFEKAQVILAHVRIPHHCEPALWFDGIAAGQLVWMLLGVGLLFRQRAFLPVLILVIASLLLTSCQLATGNDTLALIFPWRASVLLLPLATARLVEFLLSRFPVTLEKTGVQIAAAALILLCSGAGNALMMARQGFAVNETERPLLEFIRETRKPGELYLLPQSFPALGKVRGGMSSDFKPSPTDRSAISVDLQRFRLFTGARLYVDFKSVPYQDLEVLEWHRRMAWNDWAYSYRDWDANGTVPKAVRQGITHVVAARDRDIQSENLELIYEDDSYKLYRVK